MLFRPHSSLHLSFGWLFTIGLLLVIGVITLRFFSGAHVDPAYAPPIKAPRARPVTLLVYHAQTCAYPSFALCGTRYLAADMDVMPLGK